MRIIKEYDKQNLVRPNDDSVWRDIIRKVRMEAVISRIRKFEYEVSIYEDDFAHEELEIAEESINRIKAIGFDILYSRRLFLEQSAIVQERAIDLNKYRVLHYGDKNRSDKSANRDKNSGKISEIYSISGHFSAIADSLDDMQKHPEKYKEEMRDEGFRRRLTDFLIAEKKLRKIYREFEKGNCEKLFSEAVKKLKLPDSLHSKKVEYGPKRPEDQEKVLASSKHNIPINRQAAKVLTKGGNAKSL